MLCCFIWGWRPEITNSLNHLHFTDFALCVVHTDSEENLADSWTVSCHLHVKSDWKKPAALENVIQLYYGESDFSIMQLRQLRNSFNEV